MQDRFKFRIYFKGSEYAEAGYVDLTRSDVIFSLRADGQIIRNVVYDCQQEGHEGQPCNMPFTPNNNLYDIQFCTGLKDKNSKLIYEGDIVKIKVLEDFDAFGVNEKYIEINAPINYEYGGFFINSLENNIFLGQIPMSEIEVIGNIYENPELLSEVE